MQIELMAKFRIDDYEDRRKICSILSNAGYLPRIQVEQIYTFSEKEYYVAVYQELKKEQFHFRENQ